ncbi:MAG: sugar phosphate isomerase/epimerase [Lachnospiraceae bacterium]|nr:sugar phosphate isomerase/epimerase [Lachnospiraceae bacterium]
MKISVFYEHILEAADQSSMSVLDICKKLASHGIMGVEIENKRLDGKEEEIMKMLKQTGMEVSCVYGFFDFSHQEDIKNGLNLADLAVRVHAKKIMPIPGFITGIELFPFIKNKKLEKMVSALTSICNYAKESNITVVLEDFDDKKAPYSNAKGLKYFLDHVEGLKCAFDTGNFLYSEEDSFDVLPLFMNKVSHVHCKDRTFKPKEGEISQKTIQGREMFSCAVGSGCIKMKEIIVKLIENGYDDYFAIEHFGSLCQLEDMLKSAAWMHEF